MTLLKWTGLDIVLVLDSINIIDHNFKVINILIKIVQAK